jgi:Zn-finger nucleic acid-binding protein
VCSFCKTLNEVDLRTVRKETRAVRTGPRNCPRCGTDHRLEVLALPAANGLEIDRCETCHGMFFDPEELERMLAASVEPASEADRAELARLVDEEVPSDALEIRYGPCPDCGALMNRKSYGAKAGVVIDTCREHGVWLDGGELRRLAKWARAGGLAHERDVERERKRLAERAANDIPSALDDRMRRMAGERSTGGLEPPSWGEPAFDTWDVIDMLVRYFVR